MRILTLWIGLVLVLLANAACSTTTTQPRPRATIFQGGELFLGAAEAASRGCGYTRVETTVGSHLAPVLIVHRFEGDDAQNACLMAWDDGQASIVADVLSVCDVSNNASAYLGKPIVVEATFFSAGHHGAIFSDLRPDRQCPVLYLGSIKALPNDISPSLPEDQRLSFGLFFWSGERPVQVKGVLKTEERRVLFGEVRQVYFLDEIEVVDLAPQATPISTKP